MATKLGYTADDESGEEERRGGEMIRGLGGERREGSRGDGRRGVVM